MLAKQQKTYIIGFLISVVLTLVSFWSIGSDRVNGNAAIVVILGLGVAQLAVQLIFFLHLAHEDKPRWNNIAFQFAAMVVVIIVLGSMWIMQNLSYHHGHKSIKSDSYIIKDEGYQP